MQAPSRIRSVSFLVALALLACSCSSGRTASGLTYADATATVRAEQDADRAARVDQHLETARAHWDEESYTEALASVRAAIALEPRHEAALQLQREVVPAATAAARGARTANVAATAEARTARAEATKAAQRAEAIWVDPRELARDPNAFRGKPVMLQGTAVENNQHVNYTIVFLLAQVPGRIGTEPLVVEVRPKIPDLQENECLRMTAVVFGEGRVRAPGRTIMLPHLNAIDWEPGPRASATSCSALPADPGAPPAIVQVPSGPLNVPLRILSGPGGQTAAVIAIHIGGSGPFSFILDTGASGSVVSTAVAKELGLPVSGTVGPMQTAGGVIQRADVARVTQWRMGNVALPTTDLVILDLGGRNSGLDGLLGSDVLSQYGTATVDFNRGVLTLRPS
jgi:hypothetical protein